MAVPCSRPFPVRIDSVIVRSRLVLSASVLAVAALLAACSGTASGTPPPSGAACAVADATNTVELSAKNIKFSAPCIEAVAGSPITIKFTNEESVPHDVAVYTSNTKSEELVRSDIITGPNATTTVTVPAQQPGQLFFECTIHNAMNGALVVKAAPSASPS
jgi:plastocyanin